MPQNEPESQNKPVPPYPTNLRRVREEQAMITRAQLMARCGQLAAQDETKYVTVGKTTLHDLEAGLRRPRPNTAATLAAALETDPKELFPFGPDTTIPNPKGYIEAIQPFHRTGRPKKRPTSP